LDDRAKRSRRRDLERIACEALAISREQALEAGALGFMARLLVQATLPHKDPGPGVSVFERSNGDLHLVVLAPPRIGLPWGKCPRVLLCWLATEAVRTRSRHIELGGNLSAFMRELGQIPTGGRWGTITRLRDQVRRLFSSTIRCSYTGPGRFEDSGFVIASRTSLWWTPAEPEKPDLFGSFVELSQDFFQAVIDRPIPVDLRVLRALRSPLALDIYCWLTFRSSYLRRPVEIPWPALALQFGADYAEVRKFRYFFLRQARSVLRLYPEARLSESTKGLVLQPAVTHVPKRLPA
jgi:Plasmid encoded RepA protein